MPGSKSYYFEQAVLKWTVGHENNIFGIPNTPWIALFSESPSNNGGGTELSAGGYSRVNSIGKWALPQIVNGVSRIENNQTIEYLVATGNQGTAVAFALFDSQSGGNMLWWGTLTEPKTITSGTIFRFMPGRIAITDE